MAGFNHIIKRQDYVCRCLTRTLFREKLGKMQLTGKTTLRIASPNPVEEKVPDKVPLSRSIRIFPAYPILSYLYMLPDINLTQACGGASRFHQTSAVRLFLAFLVLFFVLLVLLHDVLLFCLDGEFWSKYFASGNRIIKLLLTIRYILIFWKNCASIFLFMWKSKSIHRYLLELNDMVLQIPITMKKEKRHLALFLLIYAFPFVLMGLRIAISVFILTNESPNQIIKFGFAKGPKWAKLSFYHFAEFLGGIICIAVYTQIAAFVGLLKWGCFHLNFRLIELNTRLKESRDLPTSDFQTEIRSLRDFHESLIDLCNKHEGLFSLQILVAVLNNAFVVFSSLASFFTPGVTIGSILVYLLGIIGFIYGILLLPVFHIRLAEESNNTIELFQDVIHKRSQTTSLDHHPMEEFILLTYFLQRAMTKELVVTAGGFMELNRSFMISIGAVVTGFTLFLMERVEGQASENLPLFPNITEPNMPIEF